MTSLQHFADVINFLVIEEPKHEFVKEARSTDIGQTSGHIKQKRKKISMTRWNFISCWHIVEPSKHQLYIAMNLRNPHYQVGISERVNFIKALSKKMNKTASESLFLYPRTAEFITNHFMTVINDETGTAKLRDLAEFITFDRIWCLVQKYQEIDKVDGGRGNLFFDRGISCSQNQSRSKEALGLAVPCPRAINKKMSEEDRQFCMKAEKLLLAATRKALPLPCKGKENKLYMVPPENKKFMTESSLWFPGARYSGTDFTNIVNIHIDKMNPGDYEDLPDAFMNKPVACYSTTKAEKRAALIGYPRDSAVQASLRYLKYSSCLKSLIQFYNSLPSSRKQITTELVSMLEAEVKKTGKVHRNPVHINKFVFYTIFTDRIIVITKLHKLTIIQRVPLVFASILSELPDHFINATEKYVNPLKTKVPTDVLEFAMNLYNDIWELKDCAAEERKKKNGKDPTGGQRHAPTVNKKGDANGVIRSIKLMISMHYAASALSRTDLNDMFYFVKAIGIFSKSTTGVLHAGGLLSQHLLVIGASVGVYPLIFSTYGEIGDNRSRECLKKRFSVFKNGDDACIESANILRALSFYIQETCMYCENLTCEEVRTMVTGTVLRWVDSYYPSQIGIYTVQIDENLQPKQVLVTSTSIKDVDIPTYHGSKKIDGLVAECQDDSNELWQWKTSHKINKKQRSRSSFGSRINFQPFDSVCVLLCSNRLRSHLNLEMMVMNSLGHNHSMSFNDTIMKKRVQNNTIKGKKHSVPWYRMCLNAPSNLSKKSRITFDVQDKNALLPIGFEFRAFQGELYFTTKNNAKEYLLLNYLIARQPRSLATLFNNRPVNEEEADKRIYTYTDMCAFTIVERDNYKKKHEFNPHYILFSKSREALVLYSCDENGNGSKNKLHWKPIEKVKKELSGQKRKA